MTSELFCEENLGLFVPQLAASLSTIRPAMTLPVDKLIQKRTTCRRVTVMLPMTKKQPLYSLTLVILCNCHVDLPLTFRIET